MLLSELKHDNIVQLFGYEVTETTLNIIMEFCENGSLHDTLRKFGPVPENLVALYTSQVFSVIYSLMRCISGFGRP